MKKENKITIKQDESHWEATLWDNRFKGGWYPIMFGYGITEYEATTNLVNLLKS